MATPTRSIPVFGPMQPRQRRSASLASTIAGAALIGFGVLVMALGGGQLAMWVIVALLALLLVFQALVVVTGLKQQSLSAGAGAGAWESAYAPPSQAPTPVGPSLTLKCSSCGTVFDVTDTGERPLRHACPGCGAKGELTAEDLGPSEGALAPPSLGEPEGPVAEAPKPRAKPKGVKPGAKTVRTLKLRCKNCSTVFTLRDTGERPLYHECPGCKATGVLK
jgi:predicted  nucleic acid-binding Zn-ribbon protein